MAPKTTSAFSLGISSSYIVESLEEKATEMLVGPEASWHGHHFAAVHPGHRTSWTE